MTLAITLATADRRTSHHVCHSQIISLSWLAGRLPGWLAGWLAGRPSKLGRPGKPGMPGTKARQAGQVVFATNLFALNGRQFIQVKLKQIWTERRPIEAIWKQICHGFGNVYLGSKMA